MIRYEIGPITDRFRNGHFTLLIDGMDTEYTCDPAQFAPTGLRLGLEQGLSHADAAMAAVKYGNSRAQIALERVVERLKAGRVAAGGAPLGPRGLPDTPFLDVNVKPGRISEAEATVRFLTRGRLFGLSADDRKARKDHRNEFRDHEADWHKRRATLVAKMTTELEGMYLELSAKPSSPKLIRSIRLLEAELKAMTGIQMASHGFQYAYGQYLQAGVDLVNNDIRIVPLMTNTTVDTERDAKDQVSDFTTLDEFDGSGYSTGGQALDNQAVNIDDANDRAEFDADDEAATLGAGTRSIQGNLLIKFVTNLNSSLPLHWIEYASNKTPDGSLFTVQFNAEGILQAADG